MAAAVFCLFICIALAVILFALMMMAVVAIVDIFSDLWWRFKHDR